MEAKRNAKAPSDSADGQEGKKDAAKEAPKNARNRSGRTSAKYGPLPGGRIEIMICRITVVVIVGLLMMSISKFDKTLLARRKDKVRSREQTYKCDDDYMLQMDKYPECRPTTCGRWVSDEVFDEADVEMVKKITLEADGRKQFAWEWVEDPETCSSDRRCNADKYDMAQTVQIKMRMAVAKFFKVELDRINLLYSVTPSQTFVQADEEENSAVHFSSMLFFDDTEKGLLTFMAKNKNTTVEPRRGRLVIFNKDKENRYIIECAGECLHKAVVVTFTCDPESGRAKTRYTSGVEG